MSHNQAFTLFLLLRISFIEMCRNVTQFAVRNSHAKCEGTQFRYQTTATRTGARTRTAKSGCANALRWMNDQWIRDEAIERSLLDEPNVAIDGVGHDIPHQPRAPRCLDETPIVAQALAAPPTVAAGEPPARVCFAR